MIQSENGSLAASFSDDALDIRLVDTARGQSWRLDTSAWGYDEPPAPGRWTPAPLHSFAAGRAARLSDGSVECVYPVPGGQATYQWHIQPDAIDIRIRIESDVVQRVSAPGSFLPDGGRSDLLVPVNQGVLMRDAGEPADMRYPVGSAMLAMHAFLGPRSALIVASEDVRDNFALFGQGAGGPYAQFELDCCEVAGWYERRIRLYPADRSITAVCREYRRRLAAAGRITRWPEKIARKPILERLFGGLIAFIGYNQGEHTDYVAGARALRGYGFDTVFYYPVRGNYINPDFDMGTSPSIWLSDDEIRGMQETGGVLAPWTWTYEALDNGTPDVRRVFRLDKAGQRIPHWQMDELTFYTVCASEQVAFVQRQYAGSMREMGWNHYDVTATRGGGGLFQPGAHSPSRPATVSARRQRGGGAAPGSGGERQPGREQRGFQPVLRRRL